MEAMRETTACRNTQPLAAGGFFNKLTPAAIQDMEAMQNPMHHPAHRVLFTEKESSRGVYIVLAGEVKLSINSSEGRRLSLRIARKGEILGMASALSGSTYEMTAETLYPATIGHIGREDFLKFLARHPEVYPAVVDELSRNVNMACERLRAVGLSSSAPEKLAKLLLDWSENGQTTECGTRFRFYLTHEQIGEFIGASRETVTRTIGTLKHRRLVDFQGSLVTIPSRTALATYARS